MRAMITERKGEREREKGKGWGEGARSLGGKLVYRRISWNVFEKEEKTGLSLWELNCSQSLSKVLD